MQYVTHTDALATAKINWVRSCGARDRALASDVDEGAQASELVLVRAGEDTCAPLQRLMQAMDQAERWSADGTARAAHVLAFFLLQFHATPESDTWRGAGFTEWTNAARPRPPFRGHAQPHLSADLGFYDLRLTESRHAQAELARRYGIEASCCWHCWHYWFAECRIVEPPYTEMLARSVPDFPFYLAWANQTWSGTWHGAQSRILIERTHPGPEDGRRHFEHLLPRLHRSALSTRGLMWV